MAFNAIAGIFIVGPIARVLTSLVAGSFIDRMNKRRLIMTADIIRGFIVFCMPFMESVWLIYTLLFLTNIASSFFEPSSTFYITKFVPSEDRQRFNAILGTFNSGSFLVGPALAGLLIMLFNTTVTIWFNSFTFFVCAIDAIEETSQQQIIFLGLFMAFSNTGYETFYQQNVPPKLMGRFGSISSIFKIFLQISLSLLLGLFAELFTHQLIVLFLVLLVFYFLFHYIVYCIPRKITSG